MKIASWVGSLAATLVVSLPFTVTGGCAKTSGSIKTDGVLDTGIPFVPKVSYAVDLTISGDKELKANGGPRAADRCILISFRDAEGSEIDSEVIQADSNGAIVQKVPEGAVLWVATLVDCSEKADEKEVGVPPEVEEDEERREEPEPEEEPSEEEPAEPTAGAASQEFVAAAATPTSWANFTFFGGTLEPDLQIGGENITFAVTVRARDVDDALPLLEPIFTRGIGCGLSSLVDVHLYTHVSLDLMGIRIRAASTTQIEELFLDVNHGVHRADLGAHLEVVQSNVNAWSVVESTMPLTDVIVSSLPWEEFSNHGSVDVRLAGMQDFMHANLTTTFVPAR